MISEADLNPTDPDEDQPVAPITVEPEPEDPEPRADPVDDPPY